MKVAVRGAVVLLAAAAATFDAQAGLSFERALARQRALVDEEAGAPAAPINAGFDDLTFSAGGPGDDIPRLLAPEIPRKGPALRLRQSADDVGPGLRLRIGLTVGPSATTTASLEGSALAWSTGEHSELYASVESRHWGPGWTSSLLLDGAAPAVAAVGWRRPEGGPFESRWLSWLGPWRADVFAGQLSGHTTPAHPWLIGMRLEIEPLPGLQIGASRTIEWGGTGRPEGFKSLVDSLLGHDNIDSPDKDNEPGNQLAGFDARYRLRVTPRTTVAAYAQAIGEDANRALPTAYLALFGADVSTRWRDMPLRGFVEWSDTIAGDITGRQRLGAAYRHHIYLQGYTNDGRVLGAPIGGDVERFVSVGGVLDAGPIAGSMTVHAGRAGQFAQSFPPMSRLMGLDASLSADLPDRSRAGLSAWLWRAGSDRDTALQVWWLHSWP